MRVDLPKFEQLYGKLFEVDYNGAVPGTRCPQQRRQHPRRDLERRAVSC
jgi:hypothetical protein